MMPKVWYKRQMNWKRSFHQYWKNRNNWVDWYLEFDPWDLWFMKIPQNTMPCGRRWMRSRGKGDAIPLLAFQDAPPLGGVIHWSLCFGWKRLRSRVLLVMRRSEQRKNKMCRVLVSPTLTTKSYYTNQDAMSSWDWMPSTAWGQARWQPFL